MGTRILLTDEHDSSFGDDAVESHSGVERDVMFEECLTEEGVEITTHCE